MYDVSGLLPGTGAAEVRPGTSLLVTGASRRAEGLCLDLLARAHGNGERTLVITTGTSASDITAGLRDRSETFRPDHLAIVDTTAGAADVPGTAVETLGSSGDLTGISLETSKLVRGFGGEVPIRLGLVSVSTLLMYADLQTVFRFLHVFYSRVNSGGWFGVFALDPKMHDTQAVSTVRAAFDAEVRVTDDGVAVQGEGLVEE
jgi:hypothetical protein